MERDDGKLIEKYGYKKWGICLKLQFLIIEAFPKTSVLGKQP
jgi:hypothetical protein